MCVSLCMIRISLGRDDCIINKIQNNIIMYNKCKMKLKKDVHMDLRKKELGVEQNIQRCEKLEKLMKGCIKLN